MPSYLNSNPFREALGPYTQYPNTKFHQVSGTFEQIKKFLEDDDVCCEHATIKYASVINFISNNLFQESPVINGDNCFELINGNLKFDYWGSDEEFKELFEKYGLE